jgi:predicted GIY-YIG superfamily endonuclease
MSCGVYKLIAPNSKIYIGQSKNIERRFIEHRYASFKGQAKLYNSIRKYGFENFKREILEICSEDQLNKREIYYIDLYKAATTGLNSTTGGEGNFVRSVETCEKIRKIRLGKNYNKQNKPFFIDQTLYQSLREASLALNLPIETISHRLKSPNAIYREYQYTDTVSVPKRYRRVYKSKRCSVLGTIYDSCVEASKATGIPTVTVCNRCSGRTKKYTASFYYL